MTTTVPAMKETIDLLRGENAAVMVGGAVLTPEYAEMIGADFYAADAMEGVRIAEAFYGGRK
jgi:5-methyltetrahydrofolate--homocysteine methyltransferase